MTDYDLVQRFIDTAARCRDADHLRGVLDETTRRLGFDYFALVHHVDLRQRNDADTVAIWTYPPAWAEEYLERQLATRDPVHLASHRTNIGFTWDRVPKLIAETPAHRRVRERTIKAGIGNGFTVPANIPGEANGSCSFAVATNHDIPEASLGVAQLIGAFAFHAARRLVERRRPTPPVLPRLSPRQIECVVLMGRGSTDREIARTLRLAEDTVTEYLDDARYRYGVGRRTTLVLRAVFDGQIALSDVLRPAPS